MPLHPQAIPVRLYTPVGDRPFPVLVYFHGGGWVVGNLETVDQFCRMMTNAAGCVVASVNYRHAPEHKFPVPAEDAYAAMQWIAEHAPSPMYQLLVVPVIDHRFDTPSYRENAEGYGLTTVAMRWYWTHYLRSDGDGNHPYASPLQAESLRGLPPAFVATAELDPLRDEGEAYAARLQAAEVTTVHRRYEGMIHGFLGPQANADMAEALRKVFAK